MPLEPCVLIPAYNAAETIGPLVRQTRQLGLSTLVVNDGSQDQTAAQALAAGAHVLHHAENRGKGAALRTGFAFVMRSPYDTVVTLDSDGQHDPRDIPHLLDAVVRLEAAIVVGQRSLEDVRMPLSRRWTNRVMSSIVSAMARQPLPDSQSGFRAIRRDALLALPLSSSRFEIETELLLAASRRRLSIAFVPVRTIYESQHSHIRPLQDGARFVHLIARHLFGASAS